MFHTQSYPTTLLVPIDGSVFAEQALPVALQIAREADAKLVLVRVHRVSGFKVDIQTWLDENRYLNQVQTDLLEAGNVVVSSSLIEGEEAEAITQHADAIGADLIVMTTHARGNVGRMLLGSVADQMVHLSHIPVLLVRPTTDAPLLGNRIKFPHILVPLDGSLLAEEALGEAKTLGQLLQARITLLRVINDLEECKALKTPGHLPGKILVEELKETEWQLEQKATTYLETVAAPLRAQGLDVSTQVVVSAQPADAIVETIKNDAVDLVAMATHARQGMARLFLGSVADKVLRKAPVPLLMCPPGGRTNMSSHKVALATPISV
jgi:nucleotide-binding universal stress UspA family protein